MLPELVLLSSDLAQALISSRAAPKVAAAGRQRYRKVMNVLLSGGGDRGAIGVNRVETHSRTIKLFLSRDRS